MHEFLVSVVAFIVLVGIMVVVHEFGHFAVAKLCGVRVESFSVGFGPRLFGVKYGDTDYKVCLLPLGGYVKMTGETPDQISVGDAPTTGEQKTEWPPVARHTRAGGPEEDGPVDDPGSFMAHPRWQRMLIGAAGPVSNFILAFLMMFWYYGWVNEVPRHEVKTTNVEWVVPDSAAAKAGIEPGDLITHFDTVDNPDWDQVNQRGALNQGQTIPLTVERDGKSIPLTIQMPAAAKGHDFSIEDAGTIPQFVPGPIGVQQVQPGSPAEAAGLKAGDAIEAVDGHAFHTVQALLSYMQSGQGKPMTLTVLRNGVTLPPMLAHPSKMDTDSYKLGFLFVAVPFTNDPLPVQAAVLKSGKFCIGNSTLIVEFLGRIFTHKVSVSQLHGPVGIARMAGDAAEMKGWGPKLGLASAISLNLGIVNLLPFPILDGGLIIMLLIESVIRRDISVAVKERIYQAAFVVIIAFFAFVIFNDVTQLPMFTHMKP